VRNRARDGRALTHIAGIVQCLLAAAAGAERVCGA
jgi:hypothetical protein